MYLPRSYLVNHAVLVLGNEEAAKQAMYALLLHKAFDPHHAVIVMGKKGDVKNYDIQFLKQFDAIILNKGALTDQSSIFILNNYAQDGGKIIPDVITGKQTASDEDIEKLFLSFNAQNSQKNLNLSNFSPDYFWTSIKNISKAPINYYSPKVIKVNVESDKKFLIFSETFPIYGGWVAKADGKKLEILRANGVIAAILLPKGTKEVVFSYEPRSFKIGAYIAIITIIFLLCCFAFFIWKNRNDSSVKPQ